MSMIINLTAHALLFTVTAIGISEASYLIRKRIAAERPVCPIGGGCEQVLNSRYNKLLGIHNDLLGILFYIGAAMISALIVIYDGNVKFASGIATILRVADPQEFLIFIIALMLAGATAMSAIFTYLQWKVIKAWCFWCLMSAATVGITDTSAGDN